MFNKELFFANLRWALKKASIPIGKFENDYAKVPTGRTSRYERGDEGVNPGIEFFLAAKEATGISIDVMLNADLTNCNDDELFLVKVFDNCREDTIKRKLRWNEEEGRDLLRTNRKHPLFVEDRFEMFTPEEMGEADSIPAVRYYAGFDEGAYPDGKCYNAELSGDGGSIYLMKCGDVIEVYSVCGDEVEPVWATSMPSDAVEQAIQGLYATIGEMNTILSISDKVRGRLDGYLRDKQPVKETVFSAPYFDIAERIAAIEKPVPDTVVFGGKHILTTKTPVRTSIPSYKSGRRRKGQCWAPQPLDVIKCVVQSTNDEIAGDSETNLKKIGLRARFD